MRHKSTYKEQMYACAWYRILNSLLQHGTMEIARSMDLTKDEAQKLYVVADKFSRLEKTIGCLGVRLDHEPFDKDINEEMLRIIEDMRKTLRR